MGESRCFYKNDVGFVLFVVKNTNSFDILSDGGVAFCSPQLASESVDDLFEEYSELVEKISNF